MQFHNSFDAHEVDLYIIVSPLVTKIVNRDRNLKTTETLQPTRAHNVASPYRPSSRTSASWLTNAARCLHERIKARLARSLRLHLFSFIMHLSRSLSPTLFLVSPSSFLSLSSPPSLSCSLEQSFPNSMQRTEYGSRIRGSSRFRSSSLSASLSSSLLHD